MKRPRLYLWGIAAVVFILFFLRGFCLLVPFYVWGKMHGVSILFSPLSTFNTHHIHLQNLSLRTQRGDRILTSKQADAEFFPALFFRGNILASLSGIDLKRPILWIHRDAKGVWNTQFRVQSSAWLNALVLKINVTDGGISLVDEKWRQGNLPARIVLDPVEGFLDFSQPSVLKIALRDTVAGKNGLAISGTLSRGGYTGILNSSARNFTLAPFANYIFHTKAFAFTDGTVDADAKLWMSGLSLVSLQGTLSAKNGVVISDRTPDIEIKPVTFSMHLENKAIRFDRISGRFVTSPFEGKGILSLFGIPKFSFVFQSPKFSLADGAGFSEFLQTVKPTGNANVSLKLSGADSNLFWEGTVSAPQFKFGASPAKNLTAAFSVFDGLVVLNDVKFQIGNGTVSLRGTTKANETANFLVQGEKIQIHDLPDFQHLGFLKNLDTSKLQSLATFSLLLARANGENLWIGKDSLSDLAYDGIKIKHESSKFLFSNESGFVDSLGVFFEEGNILGRAFWTGETDPWIGGTLEGRLSKVPIQATYFGRLSDGFLSSNDGLLRIRSGPRFEGGISLSKFPIHLALSHGNISTNLSGTMVFQTEHGTSFSGIGFGETSTTKVDTEDLNPYLPSLFTLSPVNWSVGIHHGKGGYMLTSPTLDLFGQAGLLGNKTVFLGEADAPSMQFVAAGRTVGPWNQPSVSGSMLALGTWFGSPAEFLGDLSTLPPLNTSAGTAGIHVKDAQAVWGSGLYNLSGTFPARQNGNLQLNGNVTDADLWNIGNIFPKIRLLRLSGHLSGGFALTGPVDDLQGDLHLFLKQGSFWGEPISTAYADAQLRQGIISFHPIMVRSYENYLTAHGTVATNGKINLAFESPQISLSDLTPAFPNLSNLSGTMQLRGKAAGSVFDPSVWTETSVTNFNLHPFHLDKAQAAVYYHHQNVQVGRALFQSGDGIVAGNANVDFGPSPHLVANLNASNFDLSKLLSLKNRLNLGLLNGSAAVRGPMPRVNGTFDFSVDHSGEISGHSSGTLRNGIANFSDLLLRVGSGEISGSGKVNVQTPSVVALTGKNLDLRMLAHLFHWPGEPTGLGSFDGSVLTSIQNPEMSLNFSLAHPTLAGLPASSFNGNLLYRNGRLIIARAQVVEPHGVINLTGIIPVSATAKTILKIPIRMQVKLENQNFAVVSDLFPGVDAGGRADASFAVEFHPNHFVASGSGSVKNGTLQFQGMNNSITGLNGVVSVLDNELSLTATGMLENPFSLTGSFAVPGAYKPPLLGDGELKLTGKSLALNIANAQVHFTPDLSLTHASNLWTLQGSALLQDGLVDTALFTRHTGANWFLTRLANLALDAQIQVDPSLRVQHPHVVAQGTGTLHLGGTVSQPQVSGDLTAKQGTLLLLGQTFSLTRGTISFSPDHKLPHLDIHASSVRRIQGSRIVLHITGYPNDLHTDIASEPPLNQTELLAVLNPQFPQQQGTANMMNQEEAAHWINTGLSSELFSPLENAFGGSLGLEEFSFTFLPTGQLGLQVGQSLTNNVTVTYSVPVAGVETIQTQTNPGAIWGLEYQLSPKIVLRGTQDHLTGLGGQVLARFNFF